jgi:hypothetical protein
MIFRPLKPRDRNRMRPVVFITDAGPSMLEVTTEHGGVRRKTSESATENLLYSLGGLAVYSLVKPKQLCRCLGFNRWEVIKYHSRIVRLRFDDAIDIYPFSTFGPDPQALVPFFDAIRELGVAPASMSTMARNSWLRTLPSPIWIKEWGSSNAGQLAFHGGRKEAREAPSSYVGAHYLDLSAAYLQAMRAPIPTHLRECDGTPGNGIVNARMQLPHSRWGPLPFRVTRGKRGGEFVSFGYGAREGSWPVQEFDLAIAGGASAVTITGAWEGYQPRPIFEHWLPWAFDLRDAFDGPAKIAAKLLTTRLWSMFAMSPDKYKRLSVTFGDKNGRDRRVVESAGAGLRMGQATFVAAIISSRIRQRLYRELLSAPGAVYCDTDGGIVPTTTSIDGWRTTRVMDRVEIRGAQAFRWQCPECGVVGGHPSWHYSVAGVPSDSPVCEGLFRIANPANIWDLGPGSLVLPASTPEGDRELIRQSHVVPAPLEEESL